MNRKRNMFFLILGVLLFRCVAPSVGFSQIRLTLNTRGGNGESIPRSECLVTDQDTTVAFAMLTIQDRVVTIPNKGVFNVSVTAKNYRPWAAVVNVNSDTIINVVLQKEAIALDAVVVVGKRPSTISATGETFTLSQKARKMNDPFRALAEIPVLRVDPINQSITTRDGGVPLVLIDGRMVNTGISPVLPADIESVTVDEVVSARYLDQGISKIIDIRLRKKRPLYVYVDARTRHDIPFRAGFAGANFEVGRSRVAVYGSVFYHYLTNDRTYYDITERRSGLEKSRAGTGIARSNDLSADVVMKWVPTERDYFAWKVSYLVDASRKSADLTGLLTQGGQSQNLNARQKGKNDNGGWLSSFFYERTFKDKSTLDIYAYFNHAKANQDERYAETLGTDMNTTHVALNNIRNQVALYADYTGKRKKFGQIEAGNHFLHTHDNIWNVVLVPSSLVRVSQISNYSFISYSKVWKRVMVLASAGLQGLYVRADERSDSYWRPKVSASVAFRPSQRQTARLSYSLSNALPTSLQLAPVSSSSNPWQRTEGNIHLRPVQTHDFGLNYDVDVVDGLRVQSFVKHNITTDIIEGFLRKEQDITIQSYRNNGHYRRWNAGLGFSFNKGSVRAYVSPLLSIERYMSQQKLYSWGVNGNATWWILDNMALQAQAAWKNRSYSAIAVTHYANPMDANLSMAWFPTDRIQVSAGVTYLGGVRSQTTTIDRPEFYQRQYMSFTSESFRPWILFSYTFRKHSKLQIEDKIPDGPM